MSYFTKGALLFTLVAVEAHPPESFPPPVFVDRKMPHTHEEPQRTAPLDVRVTAAQTTSSSALPASFFDARLMFTLTNSYSSTSTS